MVKMLLLGMLGMKIPLNNANSEGLVMMAVIKNYKLMTITKVINTFSMTL